MATRIYVEPPGMTWGCTSWDLWSLVQSLGDKEDNKAMCINGGTKEPNISSNNSSWMIYQKKKQNYLLEYNGVG